MKNKFNPMDHVHTEEDVRIYPSKFRRFLEALGLAIVGVLAMIGLLWLVAVALT